MREQRRSKQRVGLAAVAVVAFLAAACGDSSGSGGDLDAGGDADTDTDTDADTDTDTDTDTDADTDGDAGLDGGSDSDAGADAGPPVVIDTLDYDGMNGYPLNLDNCSTIVGSCCEPTTTQEEMDALCQLAGHDEAIDWVVESLVADTCYCWGDCSGFDWEPDCCSGSATVNLVTSVTCI